jgi:hypothetical protein
MEVSAVRRVRITLAVPDESSVSKDDFKTYAKNKGGEVEKYEVSGIPNKESDFFAEYSFDSLLDAGMDVVNGIWLFIKGVWGMTKWSLVLIVEGLRWLWKNGLGSEAARGKKR